MHPKQLPITDFDYELPIEKIAEYPLAERDSSKLLIYKNGEITESVYRQLPKILPHNARIVFNDSRVIEARIIFEKPTGGQIEVFCLQPADSSQPVKNTMQKTETVSWHCLVGGASKWKHGQILKKKLEKDGNKFLLSAAIAGREPGFFVIEFSWEPEELSFAEILHVTGSIPLPPYIKRKAGESDTERYQTVYARQQGSVAAPTAGLHFTDKVLEELKSIGISLDYLTLHVGAGTFKPVQSEKMEDHDMHAEFVEVSSNFIRSISTDQAGPLIAVGTTSLRTLETLYWLGVKATNNTLNIENGYATLDQWAPYDTIENLPEKREALASLHKWMETHQLDLLRASTKIIIAPGYQLKIADALITNFHQPRSTLLLLVAAVAGRNWKDIYQYALENEFRFLSYGDGCLIWPE